MEKRRRRGGLTVNTHRYIDQHCTKMYCVDCHKVVEQRAVTRHECQHNEMISHDEPFYAWKCALCGHVYGREVEGESNG